MRTASRLACTVEERLARQLLSRESLQFLHSTPTGLFKEEDFFCCSPSLSLVSPIQNNANDIPFYNRVRTSMESRMSILLETIKKGSASPLTMSTAFACGNGRGQPTFF